VFVSTNTKARSGLGRARSAIYIHVALRTQVDFVFGKYMLLRSSDRASMELPNWFSLDFPNEGLETEGFDAKTLIVEIGTQADFKSEVLHVHSL
jgi:hypothetical protein